MNIPEPEICIYQTHYFERPWTWVRRIFAMIFLSLLALVLLANNPKKSISVLIVSSIVVFLVIKRKDDIALTPTTFYHIRKSVIPSITRIDAYALSEITSIRCSGIHTDGWEIVDLLNGGGNSGGLTNHVEISLSNKTIKSLELKIDRKKLNQVIKLIYKQKQAQQTHV